MPSSFCGSSHILWPSRGCIARTTTAPATPYCPKGYARVAIVILQTMLPLFALVPISFVQFPAPPATIFYWGVRLLGLGFLYFGLEFVLQQSRGAARRLLAASIVYLPLLFALRVAFQ